MFGFAPLGFAPLGTPYSIGSGDRYWVGGTGNWSSTAQWSESSGGPSGATVPTSTNNAIFDGGSNISNAAYTATVDATANCNDLIFATKPGDGLGGTITATGAGQLLPYGNITLLSGMTFGPSQLVPYPPVSTTKTLTTNGVQINMPIDLQGGGTVQLADNLTTASWLRVISGSLDTNGKTVTLNGTTGNYIYSAITFANLSFIPATPARTNSLTLGANITVTGTFTVTGDTALNRPLIQSSVLGTARTITAAAVSLTNTDFMDITGAGAAAPFTGTSLGDCLGNSGITFTPAATQYWRSTSGGVKYWSDVANWASTSGGAGGTGRVPLPQDMALCDASSISAASVTIHADMPSVGKDLNFTGVTNSPNIYWTATSAMYGSLTYASGLGVDAGGAIILRGRGSHTITSAGKFVSGLYIYAYGGSYTMQDALSSPYGYVLIIYSGTLNTGGYSILAASRLLLQTGAQVAPAIIMGASTVTCTNASNLSWFNNGSASQVQADTSTIILASVENYAASFIGGGATYYNVWFSGARIYSISGNNTYTNFRADPGAIVQVTAGSTQTAATYTIDGRPSTGTDAACVYCPGVVGSDFTASVSTPITGNFTATIDLATVSVPTANANIIAKFSGLSGFGIRWLTTNDIQLQIGNGVSVVSTTFINLVAWHGAKHTLVVNWIDGVGLTYSLDGGATSAVVPLVVTLADSGTPLIVGSQSSGNLHFYVYSAVVTNSVATTYYNFNPSRYTGSGDTLVASTGETWTRNGNAQFTGTNLVTLRGATDATYTLAVTGAAFDPKFVSYRNAIWTAAKITSHFSLDGGSNTNITFTPARYAVAASASVNWNTTASWALGSGGPSGAAIPTATEDACFDNKTYATAYTMTVDVATCKDLCFGAAPATSGTITLAGSAGISIYGSVALLSGMTYSNSGGWTLAATTTGKTITSNGVVMTGGVTLAGVGGGWTLQDAFNITGGIFRLNYGAFDSNGKTMQVGAMSLDGTSSTRSFTGGASVITANSGGVSWSAGNTAGLTLSVASTTLNITGQFNAYGNTYGAVNLNAGTINNLTQGTFTASAVTITGRANKTDGAYLIYADFTVTGTFTIAGNSAINRVLVQSSVLGTPRTITAGAVSLTNTDLMDITGAGAATWSGTSLGDCQGNSGITFTPAETQTATGTASFSWSTHGWTTRVPLPQDDVVINNAFVAGRTITADMPLLGKNISFGCTGNPGLTTPVLATKVFGSVTMAAGMVPTNLVYWEMYARSSVTFTSAGCSFLSVVPLSLYGPGITVTLQDAFIGGNGGGGNNALILMNSSTFDANGYSVTLAGALYTGSSAATVRMGSGTWTFTDYGSVMSLTADSTITPSTSTIKLTNASATAKTFAGGGRTFNNVWFAGAGYGAFVITGNNTFNQLKSDNPLAPVQITAGSTQTVADWQLVGREIPVGFTDYHTDHEGIARTKKSGEVVVHGKRRVQQLLNASHDLTVWTKSASGTGVTPTVTAGQIDPLGGSTAFRVTASLAGGTTSVDVSLIADPFGAPVGICARGVWLKNNGGSTSILLRWGGSSANDLVTVDNTWKLHSPPNMQISTAGSNYFAIGARGTLNNGAVIDVLAWRPQFNDVNYQSNQVIPEYVASNDTANSGALGVKYYDTLNGNTVAGAVVTEAVGAAITPLATQCALQVVESTNSASSYTITKSGATDINAYHVRLQRATATANGRSYNVIDGYNAGSNVNWNFYSTRRGVGSAIASSAVAAYSQKVLRALAVAAGIATVTPRTQVVKRSMGAAAGSSTVDGAAYHLYLKYTLARAYGSSSTNMRSQKVLGSVANSDGIADADGIVRMRYVSVFKSGTATRSGVPKKTRVLL